MSGKKNKYSGHTVTVYEQPPELSQKTATYWVEATDFESTRQKDSYLIVGFDTEYKTPNYLVSRDQIEKGGAKYRVLSYQFHATIPGGKSWQGVCCTKDDARMSMTDFLTYVLGVGARKGDVGNIPLKIYLVGHFTRADIPAFLDFREMTGQLSNVRNTFMSVENATQVVFKHNSEEETKVKVWVRDTLLLIPGTSKSLKDLGELVGYEKLTLDPNPAVHRYMIENMDIARVQKWEQYRAYAVMDAEICVRYAERMIDQYERLTGIRDLPFSLTSIGVDLLKNSWAEDLKISYLEILGRERVVEKVYKKSLGYYKKTIKEVDAEALSHHTQFITECYHGGRNEQYWFGPGFEDHWIDIDLASAYPTAMSLIGLPKWEKIRDSQRISDFGPSVLGFAWIDFIFPDHVRYPTLPVRTENGLIFPREGTCYCAAPEVFAAMKLGCRIKIRKGVIIPTNDDIPVFSPFIRHCLNKRREAGSDTLEGKVWKEISNSTYGKTAQGLRKKRVYDMRSGDTKPLPPSAITNPTFAAFITSFVRALLGEIMNSIDRDYIVFSCTTDGFLTNFPESNIPELYNGPLSQIYSQARLKLTGKPEMLEVKHWIKQPLGWRTRGQATLKMRSDISDPKKSILIAKGGIFTKAESEESEQKNSEVKDLFFNRQPGDTIKISSFTGVRDIVEYDADLVSKEIERKLGMEYDWKRKPSSVDHCDEYDHVFFTTVPWDTVEQFKAVREAWTEYTKKNPVCIKKKSDVVDFFDYVECVAIDPSAGKYLRRAGPDINRLRQMLCSAWHQQQAGITKDPKMTANQFAAILQEAGIPCKRTDVENGKKKPFIRNHCPGTQRVKQALKLVKIHFPKLKTSVFLIPNKSSATSGISFN